VVEQSLYLDELLTRLRIPAATAYRLDRGEAIAAARRRCIDCTRDRDCRAWLDRTETAATAPAFCPNARFFAACSAAA
jgi:hypothetical protein